MRRRGASERHTQMLGAGELLAPLLVDDLSDRLAGAAREIEAQWVADATEVLGRELLTPTIADIEQLEAAIPGRTIAERRLLIALAHSRVDRGAGAIPAAQAAILALGHWRCCDELGDALQLVAASVLGAAGISEFAEQLFGDLAECAEGRGAAATYAAARGQRGVERFRRGELEAAIIDLEWAVAVAHGKPWETMIDDGRAHLLTAYAERGRVDDATTALHTWRAVGPLPDTSFANRLLIERGRLHFSQGHYRDALEDVELAAERLGEERDSALFEWRRVAALAQQRLGDQQAALALATDEVERAQAWGALRRLGVATMTLGVIEGGEAGVRHLRESVMILTASSARLDLARASIELGSVLRRQGLARDARQELQTGAQLAQSCGAVALIALAEQELAATYRRRARRATRWGLDALTASERRVARMAADGLSNRDIAATLVVTTKTVEMHLARTYRKLDIPSRQHLDSALRIHGR